MSPGSSQSQPCLVISSADLERIIWAISLFSPLLHLEALYPTVTLHPHLVPLAPSTAQSLIWPHQCRIILFFKCCSGLKVYTQETSAHSIAALVYLDSLYQTFLATAPYES